MSKQTTEAPPTTVTMTEVQRQFLAARDVSVPLVLIRTNDPAACVGAISKVAVTAKFQPAPTIQWDSVKGFTAVSGEAAAAAQTIAGGLGGAKILNPVEALKKAEESMPEQTTMVMLNLGDYWHLDPQLRQAIWNVRDPFKRNRRTLVGTTAVGSVPAALEHDVLVIDEPLPGPEELSRIVLAQYAAGKVAAPPDDILARAVDAVAGLSAFAAEQACILSMKRSGLDLVALRERHRQMIENTKGLTVWRGGETFEQVGGLQNFVRFARQFLAGRYRTGAVMFVDEIEKALAGVRGDLTGISQDYLATLLQFMQDGRIPGILLMGHPGTGKSLLAKAIGNTAGVPTIRADLGAMHGSLVGESQHALRHAIKVTTAVSQGRPLVVATCNSVAVLPPELVNRFKWRFFVDLPDEEEQRAIWPIHMKRLDLKDKTRPDSVTAQWNGREIEQCCETAYQLNVSLMEAAQYVVPISQSAGEQMELRRREAHGRYLSASRPGSFGYEPKEVTIGGRSVTIRADPSAPFVAPGSSTAN